MANKLFLSGLKLKENEYRVTLESFIVFYVFCTIDKLDNIEIILIDDDDKKENCCDIQISGQNLNINTNNLDFTISNSCELPILYIDCNTVIAGLCGVCRGLLKLSNLQQTNDWSTDLLGFKSACLLSPTETSIWTKFCEIDIISCVKYFFKSFKTPTLDDDDNNEDEEFLVPDEILKYESHMSQPIRTHNIYKLARNVSKNKTLESNTPIENLNLEHKYAESHKITLADIILFLCYNFIFNIIGENNLILFPIPLTLKWFQTIKNYSNGILFSKLNEILINNNNDDDKTINNLLKQYNFKFNKIENYSLYKSDPKRYKPRNRIFTKQENIDNSLEKIKESNLIIDSKLSEITPGRENCDFTWNDIPFDALPEGGNLPLTRLNRKKEQLENLVKEIISISKDNDCIIDFCSGTGHLGIILAYKLPKCKIILIENKEESLNIAKKRSNNLKLQNILFYQTNLDYFIGNFNIGTSLHACGVATDIVLELCLTKNANFVTSPCCYGKILEMPHISYPRSKKFSNYLNYSDYLYVAHCADQTHDIDSENVNIEKSLQGEYCMDIVDSDRIMLAKEMGYNVILTRMIPQKCSLKNRLLIGFK